MQENFTSFIYNGGEFLRCPLIPFPHAFSTRWGGVSTLPHLRTLNVAAGRGDDDGNVEENRRILARAAGYSDGTLVFCSQIHSAEVAIVSACSLRTADGGACPEIDGSGSGFRQLCVGELDGLVTALPETALLIKVADCAPILLCDPAHGVAGALHAGWRGTSAGIALSGVAAAQKSGAELSTLRAAIGACIHDCCFDVGEDMRDTVTAQRGAAFAAEFIRERGGTLYADIAGMNLRLLLEAGVRRENIAVCGDCTCCQPERFHSHRATGGKRGTMGAVIALPQ